MCNFIYIGDHMVAVGISDRDVVQNESLSYISDLRTFKCCHRSWEVTSRSVDLTFRAFASYMQPQNNVHSKPSRVEKALITVILETYTHNRVHN
jgi:hypothetical protein